MMVDFPIMEDYRVLEADGDKFFLTHGHLFNEYKLPPLGMGTVLCHGHTHIAENKLLQCGLRIFNPGSVSLPKGGQERQFGYWDGVRFSHHVI
jgi:predicted phosphodiesterase